MREIETDKLVVEFLEKQGVIKHIDLNYEDVVKSVTGSTTLPVIPAKPHSHIAITVSSPRDNPPSQKSPQKLDRDIVISQFTESYKLVNNKLPDIQIKGGWYSVDGGKYMRLAGLADLAETLKPQRVNIETDIAPNAQMVQMNVKIKKQVHPYSPAKNFRLFYSTGEVVHSESVGRIINAVNKQEIERASNLTDTELWQKNISVFTSYSESEVTLMHRFVKDRTHFFGNNRMLCAEEIISILGYGTANPRRTVSELINQNKLIAFKQDGRFLAPEFQFNAKAALYPELEPIIVGAKDKSISHLELAMWLSRSRRFVLGYQRKTRDWSGQVFSDALQEIKDQEHSNVQIFDGKPIDVLAKGDQQLFDTLVTQWLEPQVLENMEGIIVNE